MTSPQAPPQPSAASKAPKLANAPRTSALLAVGGPLLLLVSPDVSPAAIPWPARLGLLALAALATTAGGLLLGPRPRAGRIAASVGLVAALPALGGLAAREPALALLLGTLLLPLFTRLWFPVLLTTPPHAITETAPRSGPPLAPLLQAKVALAVSLSGWFLVAAARVTISTHALLGAAASAAMAVAFAIRATRPRALHPRLLMVLALAAAALALTLGATGSAQQALTLWAATPLVVYLLGRNVRAGSREAEMPFLAAIAEHPARLLAASFLATALLGGGLLALSESSATGQPLPLLDALFTAFSAVCVTGLTVLDTASTFSPFGQGVILVLIQLGGLGTMTFAALVIRALGRRISLRQEGALAQALGSHDPDRATDVAARILRLSLSIEAGGALLLIAAFLWHGDPLASATWRGVFTAVSAYCNAGFSLQTTSLIPYQQNTLVLQTVALLIVLGSLGPLVIGAWPAWRAGRPVPLGARLALITTAALLIAPALLYAGLEWNLSLSGLPAMDRVQNAWFQSVTLRTAGFNSVDIAHVRPSTQIVMMVAMFIGGSPGSTAGGIKTTTVALLFLAVTASLRGRPDAVAFGKRVPHVSIYRAAAITTVAAVVLVTSTFLLVLTQPMTARMAVFEATSALGTVGLSLGATTHLDEVGKVVIITTMYLGRVGPLTLFLLLGSRVRDPRWIRPEEDVPVG